MNDVITVGIDPGVVHTGCVSLRFDPKARTIDVRYRVVNGVDEDEIQDWLDTHRGPIFIEDYNPGNYGREDKRMSEALGRLKAMFPPSDDPLVKYVDNAGINTLLPLPVLKVYGVHKFLTATHHNDLVSAAKIALLGLLQGKDLELRRLVSQPVLDHLEGNPWDVTQHA